MIKKIRLLLLVSFFGCASIWATRPSQQMLNMEVSIRAAKEVSADTLAPELFRVSSETAQLARREYRLKNFKEARIYADKARVLAEKAEFESIRNGGKREAVPTDPLNDPSYPEVPTEARPSTEAASPDPSKPAKPPVKPNGSAN